MRRSIGRPARALLPLALAGCAVFLDAGRAAELAEAILFAKVLSLCTGAALYAAGGAVVSESRMRGNFLTALLLGLLGAAAAVFASLVHKNTAPDVIRMSYWTAMSGAAVMLAEIFSDRLYTLNDKLSGPLCDALTALLVAVGLAASRGDERILFYSVLAALTTSATVAIGVGGAGRAQPGFALLKKIPRAFWRTFAPAVLICLMVISARIGESAFPVAAAAAGWALLAWADAPARRTQEESGAVLILTTALASLAICAAAIAPEVCAFVALMTITPLFFASFFAAYATAAPGVRNQLAIFAYTVAYAAVVYLRVFNPVFPMRFMAHLPAAFALAALALMIPDIASAARLARVRAKAKSRRA